LKNNAAFHLNPNFVNVINSEYFAQNKIFPDEIYQAFYDNAIRNNKLSLLKANVNNFKSDFLKKLINS
jgi:hypothetical protein